ncbi:hypothetical protein BJ166DRAFT_536154 [Pestalotiopsis sp. NC0098]|nr:hypothetical protein BJ166DRAFT_536154 [Pestalotiopsis sp. NC0098]
MAVAIENRGPQLAVVDYTFAILAFITILLRCGVRLFIVRSFGIDDWLMSFAAVTFMLYCSFSLTGVAHGTGQHEANLPAENVATARMFWWLCYLMYCTTMILSKISIGYLLLRVAVKKIHAWIIYGAMVITGITCTVFFFVVIFQCSPISFFWQKHQTGTCVNVEVIIGLAYLYSACSVITDFTFALLPAWIIMGLQLHKRTKFALIPLMAMGCVASAAVVCRFAYLTRFRDPDFLWATLDIAIWSTVEQGLAIAAGSLATLRPLLRLVGWKLGLTTRPSHMGPSTYGKMGGSRSAHLSGHMSSRRRGSQGAADVLTMNSLSEGTGRSKPLPDPPTSYEVRCEARNARSRSDLEALSNVITHGKTYEVSSEYVSPSPADDKKTWNMASPAGSREKTWPEKERSHSTESTERLRTGHSSDTIFGIAACHRDGS